MARFRVDEHRRWRPHVSRKPAAVAAVTTTSAPAAPPTRSRPDPQPDSPEQRAAHIETRVRALGPIAWPARVYDRLFGAWHGRGASFYALRFFIVLVAVGLLAAGVSGDAPTTTQAGDYRTVASSGVTTAYITENHVHAYPVAVRMSENPQVESDFEADRGQVRLPQQEDGERAYALEIRIVRKDPDVNPVLLLSAPRTSHTPLSPTSDDGVTLTYPKIRLVDSGTWEFILYADRGIGPVDLHLGLAGADIETVTLPDPGWVQAGVAGGVLAVMFGAYTPGAALLRERRRIERNEDEDWPREPPPAVQMPNGAKGYAKMRPREHGVSAWNPPGKDVPEKLAKLPGKGWIIRLD